VTTREVVFDFVLLGDDRYQYPLLMRSRPSRRQAHLPRLSAIVESITPVPTPEVERGLEVKLADHWI
jgi:hypothetical protein